MLPLRNFFASFSTAPRTLHNSNMVNFKTPPTPTVPTAIKAKEERKAGEGGGCIMTLPQVQSKNWRILAVEQAIFASGCFVSPACHRTPYGKLISLCWIQWGTEHLFTKHYGNLPQFSAISGYTGGHAESPCKLHVFLRSCLCLATDDIIAYRQVCTGATGHAEAVKVTYQSGSVAYAELVEFFYRTHDPTTVDRQGPDTGTRTLQPSSARALCWRYPQNTEVLFSILHQSKRRLLRRWLRRFRRSSECLFLLV